MSTSTDIRIYITSTDIEDFLKEMEIFGLKDFKEEYFDGFGHGFERGNKRFCFYLKKEVNPEGTEYNAFISNFSIFK